MSRVFSMSGLGMTAVASGPEPLSPMLSDGGYANDPGTALLFKLNEGDGTVIHDESSFGNLGLAHGTEWTTGKYAKALLLDGIDDHIQVPASPSLAISSTLTLEAWIFPLGELDGVGTIIVKPDSYLLEALEGADPKFRAGIWRNGASQKVTSTSRLTRGDWQHVALVYDGVTMRLYLDGRLDAERAITGAIDANLADVFIGAHPFGTPSRAATLVLDEVRISNVARAAEELDPNREAA